MPQLLAALLPSKQWLKSTFWLQHFLSFASPPKPVFLFQSTSSGFRFNSYAANRRLSTIPGPYFLLFRFHFQSLIVDSRFFGFFFFFLLQDFWFPLFFPSIFPPIKQTITWGCFTFFYFFYFCEVRLDQPEDGSSDLDKLRVLRQKIEVSGITLDDSCVPGRYHHLICPKVPTLFIIFCYFPWLLLIFLSDEKSLFFSFIC